MAGPSELTFEAIGLDGIDSCVGEGGDVGDLGIPGVPSVGSRNCVGASVVGGA